jgi:hypothetical protein
MIDPSVDRQLHVTVQKEDGSYWGQVRELPGCFASGTTAAELVESAEEAVALYMAPPAVAVRLKVLHLSVKLDHPVGRG